MGRLVTNARKPVVRVKVAQTNYRGIQNLAQTVHDLTLANVATFATPLPTSANLQTDIDDLATAIASIGTKTNRGSSAALQACKDAAFIVFADLTARAAYVQQIVDASESATEQATIIAQSGFATKSAKSRIPVTQFTRNNRQSNTKAFPRTLRRIAWKKSLGFYTGARAKSYNIYATPTGSSTPVFLTSTTKTNYIVPLTVNVAGIPTAIETVTIRQITASGEGNSFTIAVK